MDYQKFPMKKSRGKHKKFPNTVPADEENEAEIVAAVEIGEAEVKIEEDRGKGKKIRAKKGDFSKMLHGGYGAPGAITMGVEEVKGADIALAKMCSKWGRKHYQIPADPIPSSSAKISEDEVFLAAGEYSKALATSDEIMTTTKTEVEILQYIKTNMKAVQASLSSLDTFAHNLYQKLQAPKHRYADLDATLKRLKWAFSWSKKLSSIPYSLSVFGSAASGFWGVRSDVDLTLIWDKKSSPLLLDPVFLCFFV